MSDALVIGAGPAGLMAAEELANAGLTVTVADAMPSVGRKFLMAGKSGLNLTKAEPMEPFLAAYGNIPRRMRDCLAGFGPEAVVNWARDLGQEVFTGSSGRVFPKEMKASPLLRAWLGRLSAAGVEVKTRWRWTGWDGVAAVFETPDGPVHINAKVTVLALGGASWSRLGSDGAWATQFDKVAPFKPANMGFAVDWSPYMTPFFGHPVKGVTLKAGTTTSRGEFVITARGIEGGGIYAVSAALREGAQLHIDVSPDVALADVQARVAAKRSKLSTANFLKKTLRLSPVKAALFQEFTRGAGPEQLARTLKALPIKLTGPLPLDEAISTAGGLRFDALSPDLMLNARPGVFCAGEMLDWEAPTGGYLISGCLATGRQAGRAAASYFASSSTHGSSGPR